MKILHVIASLDKVQGGPPPVVTGMCAALAARGHEVTLFSNASEQPYLAPEAVSFELRYFPVDWSPYQVSRSFAEALRHLRGFDILHIHMLYRFPQAVAAYRARRQGIPYCVQPHGALAPQVYRGKRKLWRSLYMETIERPNIAASAGVIFTAQQELDWASQLGIATPRSFIVPVGADIKKLSRRADGSLFRERYRIGSSQMVLWMGRLVESKGLELLLSAFAVALPENPSMRLVLAGPDSGNYRMRLEKLAETLGVERFVIFTGMIENEEKQQALCAADLFALPSQSENFGLAALEAMAVGCPVLMSPGVSIVSDVVAAGAGLLIEREIAHWSRALVELLKDKNRLAVMGRAAVDFSLRYDWSIVGKTLEDSYRSMIGSK